MAYRSRFRLRRWFRRNRHVALAVAGGIALAAAVHASGAVPATTNPPPSCTASAVACGQLMAAARGWTGAEWTCLDQLWTRESNWNAYAANPTSDARGIPQDINGWADFAPGDVPGQVRWGLDYVAERYRDPCTAWQHETADGWY
jgi:resuscitation-promoting factor RpfB